jgi:hypothetical protein
VWLEALGHPHDLTDLARLTFDPADRLVDDAALFGIEIKAPRITGTRYQLLSFFLADLQVSL